MPIDIDKLTEDELRDLNHRVVERLRMIQQLRAHGTMLQFSIGDRVAFGAEGQRVVGILARYNRRTVTVIADSGHRWNVSPGLLERAEPPHPPHHPRRAGAEPTVVVTEVTRPASNTLAKHGQSHGGRS